TLGMHTAEKAVSLSYEKSLHKATASEVWTDRCRTQISGGLAALEPDRAARKTDYWFGASIGHADIAVAAALRFIDDAHPGVVTMADFPALAAHAKRCEALPVFRQIEQRFVPPA